MGKMVNFPVGGKLPRAKRCPLKGPGAESTLAVRALELALPLLSDAAYALFLSRFGALRRRAVSSATVAAVAASARPSATCAVSE